MPFDTVGGGVTGGWGGWGWGGGYGRRGGCCRGIFGCGIMLIALYIGGFVMIWVGMTRITEAGANNYGKMIKSFNTYVDSWETDVTAFMAVAPVALSWDTKSKKAGNQLSTLSSTSKGYTSNYFGSKSSGDVKPWTSKYYAGTLSWKNATQSVDAKDGTASLVVERDGRPAWGPYKIAVERMSKWTCNDMVTAYNGKTCSASGNSVGCTVGAWSNGCPPSPTSDPHRWSYRSGQCYDNSNCFCQCTRNGRKFDTHTDIGNNCGIHARRYCGSQSGYTQKCYNQPPVKAPSCSTECTSTEKGQWDAASGTCETKQIMDSACLAPSSPIAPGSTSGCEWDKDAEAFAVGSYKAIPYDSKTPSTYDISIKLMSKSDPYYLGTLLTKGCVQSGELSSCFGSTPAELATLGTLLLVVGCLIVFIPCMLYKCCKKKKTQYQPIYRNGPSQQPAYQPMPQQPAYQPMPQPQPQYANQQPFVYGQQQPLPVAQSVMVSNAPQANAPRVLY